MRDKTDLFVQISAVVQQINNFLKKDAGKLVVDSFTDDFVLNLSFEGACKNCKKNNLYFKAAIQEMIEESVFGVKMKIQFKS